MGSSFRRGPDPLEQGLDRLVSAGRQLVDGVSGARPGARPPGRPGAPRRGAALPRLDDLGRWVEDKLDWILEDGDDWREPWQEAPPASRRSAPQRAVPPTAEPAPSRRRQPLEAMSLRTGSAPRAAAAEEGDWPDDASFSVPRWQRPSGPERAPLQPGEAIPVPDGPGNPGRPLPRSSRRRSR